MATVAPTTPAPSRRALLASAAVALAVPATVAALAVSPDAELLAKAAAFLAEEQEKEARSVRFYDLPSAEWTDADHDEYESMNAFVTRYHERLDAISMAEPVTAAGLAAKTTVILWHERCGDEPHAYNLALSVLAFLEQPVPAWADRK